MHSKNFKESVIYETMLTLVCHIYSFSFKLYPFPNRTPASEEDKSQMNDPNVLKHVKDLNTNFNLNHLNCD